VDNFREETAVAAARVRSPDDGSDPFLYCYYYKFLTNQSIIKIQRKFNFLKAEQMEIKRVPYYRKPSELTVEEWQSALRKQYALEQKFKVKNIGSQSLYSDNEVYNPDTNKTYKVSIRDNISSRNYCSCPDFRVNTLGTCKRVEFVLLSKLRFKKYQKLITQSDLNINSKFEKQA
jgi:hypothetical protein